MGQNLLPKRFTGKGGRVLFFGEDRVVGTLGDRKNGARPGFLGARAHSVFL